MGSNLELTSYAFLSKDSDQPSKADIYAVFVGKGFSLLSAENNYRISCYCEFVSGDRLTD